MGTRADERPATPHADRPDATLSSALFSKKILRHSGYAARTRAHRSPLVPRKMRVKWLECECAPFLTKGRSIESALSHKAHEVYTMLR